jgi:tetratricopeptide (TPR) repeat protein
LHTKHATLQNVIVGKKAYLLCSCVSILEFIKLNISLKTGETMKINKIVSVVVLSLLPIAYANADESVAELNSKMKRMIYARDHKSEILNAYQLAVKQNSNDWMNWGKLGEQLRLAGVNQEAASAFQKALQICEKIDNKRCMTQVYITLAEFAHDKKKQVELYEKASLINETLENKEEMMKNYDTLAWNYSLLSDSDKEIEMIHKSLQLNEETGNKKNMADVAQAYRDLGRAYRTKGDITEAKNNYQKSLEIYKTLGNVDKQEGMQELLDKLE